MSSAQVWPDGSFGITCLEKRLREDEPVSKRELGTLEQCFHNSVALHGLIPTLECLNPGSDVLGVIEESFGAVTARPLGLSSVANSHSKRRGENGISRYGRQLVKNAAYVLQEKYGKKRLTFLTLTLPTTSKEDNRKLCENWHELIRVYLQWLRRKLIKFNVSPEIVAVTEIQENRSEWQEGILGLHVHLIFVGRNYRKTWFMSPSQYRDEWVKLIKKCVGVSGEGYYYEAVENVQQVKSNAGNYLGKYLSKGAKTLGKFRALYPRHTLPSAWYSITAELRHLTIACKMGGELTAKVLQHVIENAESTYFKTLYIASFETSDGTQRICGWYGTLSSEGRELLGLDRYVKLRVDAIHDRRGLKKGTDVL